MKLLEKSAPLDEKDRLKADYDALLQRLEDIRTNFNFTDKPAEIDALIFEENAVLCRLQELLREARGTDGE